MSLHVITGRANTGKTQRAYHLIEDALARGHEAWLLLPAQPDVEIARRDFAQRWPVGVRVGTFDTLTADLWTRHGDGRSIVTRPQRSLLLTRCAASMGLAANLARLASGCVERIADGVGESWRSAQVRVPTAGQDLANLLLAYGADLSARGLVEASEALHLLASRSCVPASCLVAHQFTDLATAQSEYLKRASGVAEVYVTMVWDREFAPTRSVDALLQNLEPDDLSGGGNDCPDTHPTLTLLADGLFGRPMSVPDDGALRLVLAEGDTAEGRLIADEVLLALRDGSAAGLDDIVVVFRDPKAHITHVKHAFKAAGIAADFDVAQGLSESPFGAAVMDLIEFGLVGDRDCLLRLLRSPFGGAEAAEVRELERGWRKRGVSDERTLLADLRRVSPRLCVAARQVRECRAGGIGAAECERVAVAFRELFRLGYGDGGRSPQGAGAERDSRAFTSAVRMLSDTAQLDTDELTLTDLREGLRRVEFGSSRTGRPGHVQVTSMLRARGRRFATVIVGGLNAAEFPARPDEGFTPAGAIGAVLSAFGVNSREDDSDAAEQLLFYEVITRAQRRLVLCARSADSDGEAVALSPALETVADCLGSTDDHGVEAVAHRTVSLSSAPESGAAGREGVLAAALAGASCARVDAAIRRAHTHGGKLNAGSDAATALLRDSVSASEIETYVQCPYRWFLNYLLRPRELESEFGARDEGELAHGLLATVYQRLIDSGSVPLTAINAKVAFAELDRAEGALSTNRDVAGSLAELLGRRRAELWARRILEEDARAASVFAPTRVEWSFGLDGEEPGVDFGEFVLKGRVDRIDVDREGNALVVDYKRTLAHEVQAARLLSEGHIQGLLYLAAVSRAGGLKPAGALYRSLSTSAKPRGIVSSEVETGLSLVRTDVCDQETLEATLVETVELAKRAVQGMRAGEIEPRPLSENACRYCAEAFRCRSSQ